MHRMICFTTLEKEKKRRQTIQEPKLLLVPEYVRIFLKI